MVKSVNDVLARGVEVVLIIPDPEPFNHHTINELPSTVQGFDPKSDLVYNSPNVFSPSLQPSGYSYEFYGNDAYYGQDCSLQVPFDQPQPPQSPVIHQPHQELSIQEMEDLKPHYLDEITRVLKFEYRDEIKIVELQNNLNGMSIEIRKKEKLQELEQWANRSTYPSKRFNSFCFDDEDYTIAVTPSLPIEEPDNSLSMGNEHLDTVPAMKSDEFIKSSVENLIPVPSESEGVPEHMCDVPFHDNSLPLDVSKYQFENFSDSNDEFFSTDDDSFSIDNIDYVEASPPDSELVSSEVMEIVIPEVGGIDNDILVIKDDIFREKLLNINHLIEALNDNPTPSSDFKTKSSSTSLNSLLEETNTFNNSLPKLETLCFDMEEISSGSTTTHSDISLLEYEAFYDDHLKEISNGSTTTPSDSSLYDSLIFDLSINPFAPADRSDCYELADESKCDVPAREAFTTFSNILFDADYEFDSVIRLIKELLYDNSFPRPLEEFVSANSDAEIKSFSPSSILIKDSDSLMEEMDLSFTSNYPMLQSIKDIDYDSERTIPIFKGLLSNDTLSILEVESFHLGIPLFSRPPAKPPDDNTGILNIKMMGDISDQKVPMHKLMITLASHQEKSPDLLSHRGRKTFQTSVKCPMMIHGKNNPILDVLLFHFYPL
uniref:Reverse transcriptase domain-containing protein n=1 Tax=Tanacetum cinerariifolium TaxID=118510 RepID=A0A6L2LJQ8_TANCI|nr:hypothetical protein [Tanacetum cinerariifolium]